MNTETHESPEDALRASVIAAFDAYAKATQGADCNDKEIAAINRAINPVILMIDQNNLNG
jgi:hypothetical protein